MTAGRKTMSACRPLLPRPWAMLFDMDGTLTKPLLDFEAIRAEIGIDGPILEAMAHMTAADRKRANAILDRHERDAAEQSELNDGCYEVLARAQERRLPTALITRNSDASVRIVCEKHRLRFDLLVSRTFTPPKPSAAPLLYACERLGVTASQAWMIGDGSHDIDASLAAGVASIWISHGQPRAFSAQPTHTVATLRELAELF